MKLALLFAAVAAVALVALTPLFAGSPADGAGGTCCDGCPDGCCPECPDCCPDCCDACPTTCCQDLDEPAPPRSAREAPRIGGAERHPLGPSLPMTDPSIAPPSKKPGTVSATVCVAGSRAAFPRRPTRRHPPASLPHDGRLASARGARGETGCVAHRVARNALVDQTRRERVRATEPSNPRRPHSPMRSRSAARSPAVSSRCSPHSLPTMRRRCAGWSSKADRRRRWRPSWDSPTLR